MLPTRSLLPFFLAPALLASAASQAAMEALDNDSLSQVTGQAGISLRLDLRAGAARVAWVDDGGSLSLRNLVIDNGCVKAGDCPDGRGGNIPLGAAQLGLSLPIFGVEQPTLALDVTTGSGGGQQLAISLPDLATINDQLIASGLPAQRIRLRVASDLYIGDNSIGRIELRDITDLRGTIRVWGH
ncbi:TPA: DUF6160 family protein [Pseudomonas aeruginosa]|uniref:DUF6160 domain-containing protein n=3 Tax=Pseudomonas aeruginosa TaxID=287 RepID=A0A9P1R749_PSEAI|nr:MULTISPECIES: DUF6160 family protein [Pseudomonas]EOQ76847.1 hypothetical protein K652_31427 [Pseudomonas aeruginosa VRFPA02]CDI88444.1 hypothetical protein BN889_00365 [Pseudomonas aeruginosa PA38182]SST08417.1 Uncharacterised protein [Acinetobacter baumannii]AJF52401.1 hypothetical protein EG09_18965 [Pseudomonas aeruginosa]AKE66997.1 hypothetical protein YQ19_01940 [Pseudomonas aeruginosa]